jgi:uncharacterized membrane protein
MLKKINQNPLVWMVGFSTFILFICSSLRHLLFQSYAYDLGIFDQAVYLISQGETPFSTILDVHILGDHAAWIFYPLALLYKIYPTVYWLFAVQAISLSIAALPVWNLGVIAGLSASQAVTMSLVYLLYPLIFNVNLFDFHPEVMAVPALFAGIWCAKRDKFRWFVFNIILVLGCKAVLSLNVIAMGVWLLIFEKKRPYGIFAITAGIIWFVIASRIIIPVFSGREPAGVSLFGYLGNSVPEIMLNFFLKPGLVLGKVFSFNTLEYLTLLLSPVIWGLSPHNLMPLIGGVPILMLNILSQVHFQRDLMHQYSLPIIPFMMQAVIDNLAAGKVLLRKNLYIVLWSCLGFLILAKYGYFGSLYLKSIDTWQAMNEAVNLVQTSGSVYTTSEISSHLTHRKIIEYTNASENQGNLEKFDYILLNTRHPGIGSNHEFAIKLVNQAKNNKSFKVEYQRDDVYLFSKDD